MDSLAERVARTIRSRGLLKPGERILAGVSGGVDSMALLTLLHELSSGFGWQLVVAHFNHRLRGRASDADEQLVRRRAAELGWPFVSGAGEVRREAKRLKLSVEMAARELRHRFLATTARRRRIRVIALAHHADDQAELLLLRLLRGTSTDGMRGMRWRAASAFAEGIQIVRPLLDVSKAQLLAFATRAGLAFREDASNRGLDQLRNRIRHDLLPRLEQEYQPGIRSVLARLAETFATDAEFIGAAAERWRRQPRKSGFNHLPVAVQRRVLAEELAAVGLSPDFELIEKLRAEPNRLVSAPKATQVSRDEAGKVRVERLPPAGFRKARLAVFLCSQRGRGAFAGVEFSWTSFSSSRPFTSVQTLRDFAAGQEFFDADQVGRQILLRHWQPGDRFQPIGMAQPVKLQDLFTNAKVPAAERRRRVVAESESGAIFWVEGLRIGERFKLDSGTRRRLKWRWQRT